MAFQKKTTPETSANVAKMLPVGQGVEPPKVDNNYELAETSSPLIVDSTGNAVEAPSEQPDHQPSQPANKANEQAEPAKPELPSKLAGKTPEEIATMYLNLESEVGKHRNEVGTMRKWVDQLLVNQGNLTPKAQETPQHNEEEAKKQDIEELNLILTSPSKYRAKIQQELMQNLTTMGRRSTMQQARAEHAQVLSDPSFAQWLVGNVPKSVAEAADADPQVFNFIVNQYRGAHQATPNQPTTPAPNRVVEAPGVAMGTGSSNKSGPKNVFSRSQMMNLYNTNESEYRRLLPEYMSAIQEKRVKP